MSVEKEPIPPASNFIRGIIERDLAENKFATKKWAGSPGGADHQKTGQVDFAKIRTRFPPEPNGYLHIGHAKSIFLNFGLARDYDGICHLRFDDTNPEKESQEYVDSISEMVSWLGFGWNNNSPTGKENNLYFASDYFDFMYQSAEALITHGHAYVDAQTADEMRINRGTLTEAGKDSPYRNRTVEENLTLFREMRDGKHPDGSLVLRAKIDMASPNINMRDPAIYRIRRAHHHNTGDTWCIYPMYTFAHPIEDALEQITHSICTLEFEDQRPFYDWLMERLVEAGLLANPVPHQYEFARLNLTYVVLSKRKLIQLVEEKHVSGWDDPRLPTLAGARRRGYTPAGFKLFTDRIGVSKADSWIEYTILEDCMREVLNIDAERRIAVLDPIKLVIDNYPESQSEDCFAPNHPLKLELGKRTVQLSRELWIEREDFMEEPSKGYFRLFPGNMVRLRYGYVVKCTGCEKDAQGNVTVVHCEYLPDTKSGTPGADSVKVKGNIHWLSINHSHLCEINLFDRLFNTAHPGADGADYIRELNPQSKITISSYVEKSLESVNPGETFQFERYGYFTADLYDTKPGMPVFNRTVTLKDTWTDNRELKMSLLTEPEVNDEVYIEKEQEEDDYVTEYDISVNNSDLSLSVIDEWWKGGEITIPDFQREFVWDIKQSSKLIESFLLGLPIPQVFFYTDEDYKNLVIDGQQRIKSIIYFLEGYFGSETTQSRRQVFRLQGLDSRSPYANKRFVDLDETSQRKLKQSTLRAVIVKQIKPDINNSSIYHIFERLNTGGTALKPQEIRNCVYRGEFMNILRKLNQDSNWRKILGKFVLDKHQKDVELLLRIFALSNYLGTYEKPMKKFLNDAMKAEKNGLSDKVKKFEIDFVKATSIVIEKLGDKPFHIRGPLNVSVLDSVMCAVIDNVDNKHESLISGWKSLKENEQFKLNTYYGTSDTAVVEKRLLLAKEFLYGMPIVDITK